MKKINFNTIKSWLIIGYGSMAALLLVVVFITLSQISNILLLGVDVLENKQPSRMYVDALRSGVRHSNVSLQSYLLSGDDSFRKDLEIIWEKEIKVAKDSIDSLKGNWVNPENIILLERLYRTSDRIKTNQKNVINNASFSEKAVSIDIYDFPFLAGDSIFDLNELQTWVNSELSSGSSNKSSNGDLYLNEINHLSEEIDALASELYANLEKESQDIGVLIFAARDRFVIVESAIVIISILLFVLLFRLIHRKIKRSLAILSREIHVLSEGNIIQTQTKTNDELDKALNEIYVLNSNLLNVKNFALEVGKGSFDNDISVFNNEGEIGKSLAEMRDSLKNVSEEARIRNWSNKGFAEFGDLLRKFNNDIAQLSEQVITFMVKYLNANQGSIFVVETNNEDEKQLKLTATYAYDRKKFIDKTIAPGQGLVGQVFLEKQSIYLKEIPKEYITITSGLGKATPSCIFIVPLVANDTVFGVMEIGSFNELTENEKQFIESVAENIASSIQSVKINEQTNKLLGESQEMTEQMRSQEEEMRQNMEELQATQEEMERSQKENSERINAIEKSGLAFVEFKPSGEIITADNTFIKLFGYHDLDEIRGRHHRIFVQKDYAETDEYASFWQNLRSGKPQDGVFERFKKNGEKIYIKGAYVDVKDMNGDISRIIKFAIDITEIYQQTAKLIKEKEDLLGKLNQIGSEPTKTGQKELKEIIALKESLELSLMKQLQENDEKLRASISQHKSELGLS